MCVRSLIYPDCKAPEPSYTVTCDLSGPTIIFHIISKNGVILGKEFIEHKMCDFIFFTDFV